jgi:hypothetical protein
MTKNTDYYIHNERVSFTVRYEMPEKFWFGITPGGGGIRFTVFAYEVVEAYGIALSKVSRRYHHTITIHDPRNGDIYPPVQNFAEDGNIPF